MYSIKRNQLAEPMTREQVLANFGEAGYLNTRHKEIEPDARTAILVGRDGEFGFRPSSGSRLLEFEPETGIKTLQDFLKVPWPIGEDDAKGITPATFATLATDRIGRAKKFTFVTRDNKVTGWTVTKEPIMEPERVVEMIEKVMPDALYGNLFNLPNYNVVIDVFSPVAKPGAVGDIVNAGATVLFSPYGTIAPSVRSFVRQLLCFNGNSTDDVLRKYEFTGGGGNGNSDKGYWNWLKNTVKKAANSVEGIVTRWRGLLDEHIPPEERSHVIAGIIKDAKLNEEQAAAIWAHVVNEPVENAYDAMNLITWAASHTMTDPRMILRARSFAEEMSRTRRASRACPMCHKNEGALVPTDHTHAG